MSGSTTPCPQKLLVINQYYAPDIASTGQYAADICSGLVKQGIEVHVVTGQPSYTPFSPTAPAYEVRDGVHVYRVSLGKIRGRERMKTRFLGYIRFLSGAWKRARALLKTRNFDSILTFHNPPFVPVIGARLAGKYNLRFTYVVYDIHPDILVATGWRLPGPVVWLWGIVNKMIFRQARAVIVLGEGMRKTMVHKKKVEEEKVKVIPIWARPELNGRSDGSPIRRELGIGNDDLLVLHSGNMGIMHPLDVILDAAKGLQGEPVRFLFVGDGAKREHLLNRVKIEEIEQVDFLPFQPEERFIQLLAASDACLVALQSGMEYLALPSRAFTFLSAARPLITIMHPQADVARLIAETDCGWNVTTGHELTKLIRNLLEKPAELKSRGQKARKAYEERFQKARIVKRYGEVVRDTVGSRE